MLLFPTNPAPDFTQSFTLDEVSYDFRFQWNEREKAWYLFLSPTGLTPLIKTKMVNGWDILAPFKHIEGIPQGILILFDSVALWGRPSFNDVGEGRRFLLTYLKEEEIV